MQRRRSRDLHASRAAGAAFALLLLSACNTPATTPPVETAPPSTVVPAALPVTVEAPPPVASASASAAPARPPNGDADGDGIPDERDACPREPGPAAPDARTSGCPRFVRWRVDRVELLQPIAFEFDKEKIKPSSFEALLEVRDALNAHPEATKIEIQGHYPPPRPHMAMKLSDRRAQSVRAFLVHHGVDAARLVAHGYGEDVPLADPRTAEGKAKNRRIEIKILPP
jgi:OOP family OmpA-OmpF porin